MAFVEDYGMYPAHVLVQGVDLWLNLPRVPLEASGTSGMKAALNGVPQLSTIDGWWEEGFDGTNGWALPHVPESLDIEETDRQDAAALYRVLEQEIVPSYYDRDARGVPLGVGGPDAERAPGRGQPLHRTPDGAGLHRAVLRARHARRRSR